MLLEERLYFTREVLLVPIKTTLSLGETRHVIFYLLRQKVSFLIDEVNWPLAISLHRPSFEMIKKEAESNLNKVVSTQSSFKQLPQDQLV